MVTVERHLISKAPSSIKRSAHKPASRPGPVFTGRVAVDWAVKIYNHGAGSVTHVVGKFPAPTLQEIDNYRV